MLLELLKCRNNASIYLFTAKSFHSLFTVTYCTVFHVRNSHVISLIHCCHRTIIIKWYWNNKNIVNLCKLTVVTQAMWTDEGLTINCHRCNYQLQLTLCRSIVSIKSMSTWSEMPPCTTNILSSTIVANGNQLNTSLNMSMTLLAFSCRSIADLMRFILSCS